MSTVPQVQPPQPARRSRLWLVAIAAAAVLVAVLAYLFQPWRLFTTVTVREAAPPAASQASSVLLRGTFVSQAHETTGTASVLRLSDGSKVLRLEGLRTSDGPDLKVWLTAAPATAEGGEQVEAVPYRALGDLKGNAGDQNYAVPADADLSTLRTVSIWCERFSVSFGAAALM
jgi:electron transfer DM13